MPWPRVLGRVWPACVGAACFMGAVAALDVAVPAPVVDGGRRPESAGYLLGAFAASGILGGAVYGTRSWPARPAVRAAVTSLVMTGVLVLVTVADSNGAMLAVLLVAGLFGPPSLIARSLGVQEDLAGPDLAVGFSLLSAAAGAGAAATSFALGGLLAVLAVQPALVTVLAALAFLTVTMTAVELARAL